MPLRQQSKSLEALTDNPHLNAEDMMFIHSLLGERNRYRAALEQIANEDYRGNRSSGAQIAYHVLRGGVPADEDA